MIQQYRAGASIEKLVRRYEVHRTTVMHHLDQSDVARLTPMHKKNDETGALAAAQYGQGRRWSVATVTDQALAPCYTIRVNQPTRPDPGMKRSLVAVIFFR